MGSYLRDPLEFLTRTARTHGDFVRLDFPGMKIVLASAPEAIEHVLVTANKSFVKDRFTHDLSRLLGQGLLTSEGDAWRRQRRLVQPAFHRERIAGYATSMVACTERMLDGWRDGMRRDLHADLMKVTLEIVAETLFSTEVSTVARDVGEAMEAVMAHYADPLAMAIPSLERLPLPANLRFRAAERRIDAIIRDIVRRRRAANEERGDLLGMLLAARDDDGSSMSDQQVRDEVVTLFLAGHETTALALSWTFYLLGQNTHVRDRLEVELREVLAGRSPTMGDLPRLTYTNAVVQESMRIFPPVWVIGRESLVPFELGGHRFPAGIDVWFSQWVVHRDARWFPEPMRFRPERWLDGLEKALPRFAYFPFGGGPRQCIGNAFALTEAALMLATMAQRFRLVLDPRHPVVPLPSITVRPKHGIKVSLVRRDA